MKARTLLAVVAAALALVAPARADEGLGVNTQLIGAVASTCDSINAHGRSSLGGESCGAWCGYSGGTNATGGWDYEFSGAIVGVSATQSPPELADLKCTLMSPAQGLPGERPTLSASCEIALGSAASECWSGVVGWPARPVVLCVDGYVIFGPMPVLTKTVIHSCKASSL